MGKFKSRGGSNIAKRLSVLETKQKADEKTTEHKVQYYETTGFMDQNWSSNNNFVLRLAPGTDGEGTNTAGSSRVGTSVNLRSCVASIRVFLQKTGDGVLTVPNNSVYCRIIFVDNLTDATSLAATDILQSPFYPLTSGYKNKMLSGKKYRVHADYKFQLNDETPQKILKFAMKIPKSGRVCHYDGLAQNPSDLNLSMIWIAEGINPVSFNKPEYKIHLKSRFADS